MRVASVCSVHFQDGLKQNKVEMDLGSQHTACALSTSTHEETRGAFGGAPLLELEHQHLTTRWVGEHAVLENAKNSFVPWALRL